MRHMLRACRGEPWGLSWSPLVMRVRCIDLFMQ